MPPPGGAHGVVVTAMVPVVLTFWVDDEFIGLMVPKLTVGWHCRFWQAGLFAHVGSVHTGGVGHMCMVWQPGKLTHAGSAQSMRPLSLSSMPLLQISVPSTWQRGSVTHAGSGQLAGLPQLMPPSVTPPSLVTVQMGVLWQKVHAQQPRPLGQLSIWQMGGHGPRSPKPPSF